MTTNYPMSNKVQALALLHDHQISAAEISVVGEICRKHLEQIRQLEKMTAQRAVVLGITLWRIRLALPHGQWTPWQQQHLGQGKTQVNYFMRLAVVFLVKSRATKTELRALPGDSVELSTDNALSRSLLARLEKFIGECSLNELLVKHGIRGVTRDTGGEDGDGQSTAAGGEQMVFTDVAAHFYGLRQTVCRREVFASLTQEQMDAAWKEIEEIYHTARQYYQEARGTKSGK